jgi:hypothetical protein
MQLLRDFFLLYRSQRLSQWCMPLPIEPVPGHVPSVLRRSLKSRKGSFGYLLQGSQKKGAKSPQTHLQRQDRGMECDKDASLRWACQGSKAKKVGIDLTSRCKHLKFDAGVRGKRSMRCSCVERFWFPSFAFISSSFLSPKFDVGLFFLVSFLLLFLPSSRIAFRSFLLTWYSKRRAAYLEKLSVCMSTLLKCTIFHVSDAGNTVQ